jgi:hypothetical protein
MSPAPKPVDAWSVDPTTMTSPAAMKSRNVTSMLLTALPLLTPRSSLSVAVSSIVRSGMTVQSRGSIVSR